MAKMDSARATPSMRCDKYTAKIMRNAVKTNRVPTTFFAKMKMRV